MRMVVLFMMMMMVVVVKRMRSDASEVDQANENCFARMNQ
jgi:hypothetical protein